MPAILFSDGRARMPNTARLDHRAATWGADWWLGRTLKLQGKTYHVTGFDPIADGDGWVLLTGRHGETKLSLVQLNLSLVRGSVTLQ